MNRCTAYPAVFFSLPFQFVFHIKFTPNLQIFFPVKTMPFLSAVEMIQIRTTIMITKSTVTAVLPFATGKATKFQNGLPTFSQRKN